VFIETCWESHDFGCFMSKAGDSSLGEASQASAWVQVWERGEVGDLDYAVLTTTGGDDLVAWMDAEGFDVPAAAAPLISTFETEGVFFFVARLAAGADPDLPLTPVRFVLEGMDVPTYPLRLTGLGAPAGEELELTLWMIFPSATSDDPGWVPQSHRYGELPDRPEDIDEFDDMRDAFHASATGPDLLVRTTLTDDEIWYMMDSGSFCAEPWFTDTCVPFEELGLEPPDPWSDEMALLGDTPGYVMRYEGFLDAGQLSSDLTFRTVSTWTLPWTTNIYQISRGECREEPGCTVASRGSASGAWVLAVLVLLVPLARLVTSRRR